MCVPIWGNIPSYFAIFVYRNTNTTMKGENYLPKVIAVLLFALFLPVCCLADNTDSARIHMGEKEFIAELNADHNNMRALCNLADYWTRTGEFQKAADFFTSWLESEGAQADGDILLPVYANLGQWCMATDDINRARYYLDKSRALLDSLPENVEDVYYRLSFYTVNNTLGVYYVNVDMDYHKAISYFFKGFEAAEKHGDREKYTTLGCNLVITYFLRNDPSGLQYALRIYEYGKEIGDDHIIFRGSHVSALMYYIMGDYQNALTFIEEAMSLYTTHYDKAGLYNIYANILLKTGNEKKAEQYYLKALDMVGKADPADAISATTATYVYLCYGEYLLEKKKYREAERIFSRGVALAGEKGNKVFRYRLYRNLSATYRSMGELNKALDYYIVFHQESDSIFNVERERSINELMVKYEAEKKGREIEQSNLKLERETRKFQAAIFMMCIIITVLVAIYIMYRNKYKLYIRLLKQHQETLGNERILKERIEEMKSEYGSVATTAPALDAADSEAKYAEIFAGLEELMRTTRAYRQPDITVEKAAKMIGTNRTYLSKAINEKTGLSFNYYINSYRIEEAVRILSDPNNDIPLKTLCYELGFQSLSTFYKLFNSVKGMTPSKFREQSAGR